MPTNDPNGRALDAITTTAPTQLGFDEYYTQLVSQSTADFFTPYSNGLDFMGADFGLGIFNFT
jgi:hypothetical protein